ncbi:hypothetical protein [Tardiphaga sp.]|jgi:hypothetical protein|uniref:hypothetical protein n=1 Tax=Tardiphaga sp. TaxID=1926292 RepID=UPI0037D99371
MSAIRQLDIAGQTPATALSQRLMAFLTRRGVPAPTTQPARKSDGKFSPVQIADAAMPDAVAGAICAGYFASVCAMMGLDRDRAKALIARNAHGGIHLTRDKEWRSAIYARQLAMYLASTEANISQAQIGRVTGLDRAGVHKALRAVEDLRDRADYEELIACVLVDVAMNGVRR